MSDKPGFLDKAYRLGSTAETRGLYDDWSETYEKEVAENGYVTPSRCAAALGRFAADLSAPVLDIGCGTGLSGLAFRVAGFAAIDGTDLSAEMLAGAEAKEVYRRLFQGDATDPLPVRPGDYAHMAAVGVIHPGHAPPETLDDALAKLPAGGCMVFSLNDHALEVPEFPGRVRALVKAGTAELVFEEHGPHLPGRGLESTVYVLRRL